MTVVKSNRGESPRVPGLRQQQKDATRARITAAAMELFAERGFDRVSVSEIAVSAGVTEKTVFNHFATKEDLVYSHDQEFETALLDAVRLRPPGTSVLEALRAFLLQTYSRYPGDPAARGRAVTMAALIAASPALRVRERDIFARYAVDLRNHLALELGARAGDLRPAVAAEALVAVHQAVIAGYREGLLGREPADRLSRRMLAASAEAFDLLADGLATFATQPRDHTPTPPAGVPEPS